MRRGLLALAGLMAVPTAAAHEAGVAAPSAGGLWTVTAAASGVMAVAFAVIAFILWRAILRGRQLTSNPLLTGMALMFTTCAVGHALHLEHALLPVYAPEVFPVLGLADVAHAVDFGRWARVAMVDPVLLGLDLATAAVAVWYLSLRRRYQPLFQGAELTEDLHAREREARRLQDTVVQGLTEAKLLLERGRPDRARQVVAEALEESRGLVDLFLEEPRDIEAGMLKPVAADDA